MPYSIRTNIRDYYDTTPPLNNACGDIWSDLPSFGLLGNRLTSGIVITPACDLSNRKVETITYLPIIPVRSYFATVAFIPEILRAIEGQLEQAQVKGLVQVTSRFFPPSLEDIQTYIEVLQKIDSQPNQNQKVKNAIERAKSGMRLLACISDPEIYNAPMIDFRTLFGEKDWKKLLNKIVTNSHRSDVYFLPADEQPSEWSGIPCHSLVLFRYPLTAPVEVFECAQDIQLSDWDVAVSKIGKVIPGAKNFATVRPLKRISLRPRFLSDLLTRYVSMHVRLGSPDFTEQTIDLYVDQIGID